MSHSFYLELGSTETTGYALDVWDGYEIALDMLSPGSPWTFSLWRIDERGAPRNGWAELLRHARIGERITLSIDGVVMLDGKVRTRAPQHDRGGAMIVISGTDLAGQAMHAHADPTRSFANLTLQTALERLFEPLSIAIELGEGVDAQGAAPAIRPPRRPVRRPSRRRGVVDRFRPRIGESVWQCADALCRKAGYVLWTAPGATSDRLVLRVDKPKDTGDDRFVFVCELSNGVVTERSNVLGAKHSVSIDRVPSDVTVFADSPRGDASAARLARRVENDRFGGALFSLVVPSQPEYLLSSRARTVGAAQREATRRIGDANRSLESYTCSVAGHGQRGPDGRVYLYAPNELARVRDDVLGVDMAGLIVRAVLKGGRAGNARGQTTELTIVPRGAIKADPEP